MESIGLFALGLLLLLLGADSALRGAAGLAQRFGLSPFSTGLLLVAFATSVPELAVNAYAVSTGNTHLALGNAVGSNIVNIGLTLALAALAAPLLVNMRLLGAQVVFIVVATGIVLLFGLDGLIARWEGAVLLGGFAAFLVYLFKRGQGESKAVREELGGLAVTSTILVQNLVRLLFAAALLYFGSKFVVQHAPTIGLALGMGSLLTGMVIVAIGTALPEIATAVMAARNGQGNVVVGQVLGACLFNLLFMVGGMAVWTPLPLPASLVTFQLPAAMAFALLLYPVLRGDLRIARREAGLLLLAFGAWLGFVLYSAFG